ncbi:MAG: transcription termination factor NusA [Candidatus Promineifilaceae bacterium]|jgi:N utilization substance protein A
MKSEFLLAFNEICESRGLPKEDVLEALKTALVSAYRRDANVSNTQEVVAEIDPRTGEPTIFAEKEVVDSIFDNRTEVLLSVARKTHPDAQMGDLVLVDSTTEKFGRIAAQTAKQVLLQRVREAEREHLFEDFSGREGELVNGTVQSISGQHITIGLGRTEAILPKSQQVPRERYRAHDKIRVYVLEVRRTSRGPQIVVSRNHRNLLRRLLELEVPEIYNGQVEVKSIAREAGQRSKVAVFALQPGVDPVGACVGMRGVRIQSIVRELNDEKIDVIEWDPDQQSFILKALSPARVSHVFLEEHPDEGRTAVVIVPDDQLSLAIGREGQNARLAAKLTGWRIDIKSLTEAAVDALDHLDNPAVDPALAADEKRLEQINNILEKKEAGRPITSEDYLVLDRLIRDVEGRIIAQRAEKHAEIRRQRAEIRKQIPDIAWHLDLEELDLPGRIHNLLLDNEIETVGAVLLTLEIDEHKFLEFRGFSDEMLDTLKEYVDAFEMPEVEQIEEEALAEGEAVEEELLAVEEEAAVAVEEELEAEAEEAVEAEADEEEASFEELLDEEEIFAKEEELEEEEAVADIDDLSKSIYEPRVQEQPKKKKGKIVVVSPISEEEDEDDEKSTQRRGRSYVYDEEVGEVVVKRKRKGSRRRGGDWDDFDDNMMD